MTVDTRFLGGYLPTHYCTKCGALWKFWSDGTWNLRSQECGPCCDNAPMEEQIVPMTPEKCAQLIAQF